jgi:hypothetical protein
MKSGDLSAVMLTDDYLGLLDAQLAAWMSQHISASLSPL